MPKIEDLLHRLHGTLKFTTLVLKWGYHQQRLAPEDGENTAFVTQEELHLWNVLPFDLANAPTTFM